MLTFRALGSPSYRVHYNRLKNNTAVIQREQDTRGGGTPLSDHIGDVRPDRVHVITCNELRSKLIYRLIG